MTGIDDLPDGPADEVHDVEHDAEDLEEPHAGNYAYPDEVDKYGRDVGEDLEDDVSQELEDDVSQELTRRLADILTPGGVGAERVAEAAGHLAKAADDLAVAVEAFEAPETVVPKVVGVCAQIIALHFGVPPHVAEVMGDMVKAAAESAFKPDDARGSDRGRPERR